MKVGIIGAGAMGSGIAQVAAMAGHEVCLFDANKSALSNALININNSVLKLVEKNKLSPSDVKTVEGRIYLCECLNGLEDCDLIIEAIIEDIQIKKDLFQSLEKIVKADCIIATNTSSLSISAIASSLQYPQRCLGIHFFNPPVLMKLVEVIPAIQTDPDIVNHIVKLIASWGKSVVVAKDSPGFIVNKVARPYYSEALRIFDEGLATIQEIDQTMASYGFKMGPFLLMDFIGHDVNYRVTESIWKSFYYHPRYKPSLSQLKLLEAGYLGKKTKKGFYDHNKEINDVALRDEKKGMIFMRIIALLINEAADTLYYEICSLSDLETAMTLGVNYPKGLMTWAEELGYENIVKVLDNLYEVYREERYCTSIYLRNLAKN